MDWSIAPQQRNRPVVAPNTPRSLQEARRPAIGFVIAAEQDIEKLAATIAFGFGDEPCVGNVFRRNDRADQICVFDRKIGYGRYGLFDVSRAARKGGIPKPSFLEFCGRTDRRAESHPAGIAVRRADARVISETRNRRLRHR